MKPKTAKEVTEIWEQEFAKNHLAKNFYGKRCKVMTEFARELLEAVKDDLWKTLPSGADHVRHKLDQIIKDL